MYFWNDGEPCLKKYGGDKGDSKNDWTRILKANVYVCVCVGVGVGVGGG